MAMLTLNDSPVLTMVLRAYQLGGWTAQLEVDTDEALSGAVTLADGDHVRPAYVLHSAQSGGRLNAQIIGGAGGLKKILAARAYQRTTVREVLRDIATDAGETLDTSFGSSVLTTSLMHWQRAEGSAGEAIAQLATHVGASWRILASGKLWLGTETWRTLPGEEPLELDIDGMNRRVDIAPETIDLEPGMSVAGRNVTAVTHHLGSNLRASYWYA